MPSYARRFSCHGWAAGCLPSAPGYGRRKRARPASPIDRDRTASDAIPASGDASASPAELWLQRHGDALSAFPLARVLDRASAEDLVQDTLLAALRGQHAFRGSSAERSWLIGILKHKCIDEIRRRARSARGRQAYAQDIEARLFRHPRTPGSRALARVSFVVAGRLTRERRSNGSVTAGRAPTSRG